MNDEKVVLDLCGGTGSWSKPYKETGYKVLVVTLPKYSVTHMRVGESTVSFLDQETGEWGHIPIEQIHGILAAPPCTQFSMARNGAKTPRDFREGMICVKACMEFIWEVRMHPLSRLQWWALENPRAYLRQFLGRPKFTFQAYEYGDPMKKPTDIWGYFNEPKKKPIEKPTYPRKGPGSWANQSRGGSAKRSMTPPGFAKAFMEANQ